MHACPNLPQKFDRLRRQAEELIRQNRPMTDPSSDEILELIHELEIHHADMEIQNKELKRAQQDLYDLHHQYERLYEFAPCGYVTLDAKGGITRANLTAVRFLGVPKKYLLRSVLSDYIAVNWKDAFLAARRNVGCTGEKQRLELQIETEKGSKRWMRVDITADRDSNETVVQWFVVLVDINREKKAETQIRMLNESLEQRVVERTAELEQRARQIQQLAMDLTKAEDRELGRFAAILHDDFQQEAAYIKFELNRLRRQADTEMGQQLASLELITGDYIEKIRHLSHALNPPALHRRGFLAGLDVLARDMQHRHGLALTLHTQPEVEPVSPAAASMLYRSVRELLFNVVKHAEVNAAVVDVCNRDKLIRITVTDKGRGFDYPTVMAGEDGETGFGLYNIEERMMFLGGSMQVTTRPGKGSCIVLSAPRDILAMSAAYRTPTVPAVEKKPVTSEPAGRAAESDDKTQIRILMVEDHKFMREALTKMLQEYKELKIVGRAVDGLEAIALSARLKPQVILMDVTMPKMDGVDATTRIKHNHPDIRIIGLSMHDDNDIRQKMLNAGAEAFLDKTVSPERLIKAIRTWDSPAR